MEESLREFPSLKEAFHLKEADAGMYSPLVLAYIGDAVYELLIRTKVVNAGNVPVNKMHKKTSSLVKASAQAQMILALEEELNEQERAVYRRGRNAKSATMAKNATMRDYRMATGFEALIGWLYLSDRHGRLVELVGAGLTKLGVVTGKTGTGEQEIKKHDGPANEDGADRISAGEKYEI